MTSEIVVAADDEKPVAFGPSWDIKAGDRFHISTPELIVVGWDREYLTFTTSNSALRRGHASINKNDYFPYLLTKVFKPGEIVVASNGTMWGYDGNIWSNGQGEEKTTEELRSMGARVLPTEML